MTTFTVDEIVLPNGVRITSTPDGQVAIFERDPATGEYKNSAEHIPVKHPTGTFPPQTGHRFARLDQDNVFLCNTFCIESNDPAEGASGVLAQYFPYYWSIFGRRDMRDDDPVHAVGGNDEAFPTNYLGIDIVALGGALPFNGGTSSTERVYLQTRAGETVAQFMARFAAHLHAQMFDRFGIGTQYPSKVGTGVNFAVTRDSARFNAPIQINEAYNKTRIQTITLVQSPGRLDASPLLVLKRRVKGRLPKPGDNCGQLTFSYADTGYAGLNVNFGDPSPNFQAMIRNGAAYGEAMTFTWKAGQETWQG